MCPIIFSETIEMERDDWKTRLKLFHVGPPYQNLGGSLPLTMLPSEQFVPGSLLVIDVSVLDPEVAWDWLTDAVAHLRAAYPSVTLVVRHDGGSASGVMLVAHRAAELRVPTMISPDASMTAALRFVLTRPGNLGKDVTEWLERRGVRFGPQARHLVHKIIENSTCCRRVGTLLNGLQVAERTARFCLRNGDLPAPNRWLDLARGLNSALYIQRHHQRSLFSIALELGYSDHSGLCKHMSRLFDERVGGIRKTLGWEWLLERWLAKTV